MKYEEGDDCRRNLGINLRAKRPAEHGSNPQARDGTSLFVKRYNDLDKKARAKSAAASNNMTETY